MTPFTLLVILIMLYVYTMAIVSAFGSMPSEDDESDDLLFVLLVPALNEAGVIGQTLTCLLKLSGDFILLVIDDASDDGTVDEVRSFLTDRRVRLLERSSEEGRRGKGAALNAGFAALQNFEQVQKTSPDNVIVVVFDADARVQEDFLETVTPYFRDEETVGVQSAVRMYNKDRSLLTFWQHFEFMIWGEIFSKAKDRIRSATLGGNGQCVRLSCLTSLGEEPWRPSLTEDLDLSLRLIVQGKRLRFCPSAIVWQEALPQFRRLVRQRSRWFQGHLAGWEHLGALLKSPIPFVTRLDLLIFLLLPTAFLPIGLVSIASWLLFILNFGEWEIGGLLGWYFLAFGMTPLLATIWIRAGERSLPKIIWHSHLFAAYSFVWFLATVVACWNILLGRRAWAKTSRTITGPIAMQTEMGNIQIAEVGKINETRD